MKIFTALKHIFVQYLYLPKIKPIQINDLVKDLQYLNKLFDLEIVFNKKNKNQKKKSIRQTKYNKTHKIVFEKSKSKSKSRRFKSFLMLPNGNK
jgi:hypothetical protein